jgi:uncharacterized pyridoxamine 5'-phosphate oxidase family protein
MSIDEIRPIVEHARHATLATCEGGQPRIRPMSFTLTPDGRLLSSTRDTSGKMREFAANPRVELCFVDADKNHLRIEGRIDVAGGDEAKRVLLEAHPPARRHFGDPDHPNLIHVEVIPTRIRWKPPGFCEYRVVRIAAGS